MYTPRIKRPNKYYPVKIYNGSGDYIQYLSWAELEARDKRDRDRPQKNLVTKFKKLRI